MTLNLDLIKAKYPFLRIPASQHNSKEIVFTLDLGALSLPPERRIETAELMLTRGFPEKGKARIRLSKEAILALPHVEENGWVCLNGDPGPGYGLSPEYRIMETLYRFQEFIWEWGQGQLDFDFYDEPLNYWYIWVKQAVYGDIPIRKVWTTNDRPSKSCVREGRLLLPDRIALVGDGKLVRRLAQSRRKDIQQEVSVRIADIPIDVPLVPSTWPKTDSELERLLFSRLNHEDRHRFLLPEGERRKGRGQYRVILLRHMEHGYAFLMPGGPHISIGSGKHRRTYKPPRSVIPLTVERLDPSWTVGRDQHPEVYRRQQQRVLIIGLGALGSPVADHLAKAGVGELTLVDDDTLEPANLGRHLLGANALEQPKVEGMSNHLSRTYPAVRVKPIKQNIEDWLIDNRLDHYDLVLDLTGMEEVRRLLDRHRRRHPCPLLIAWMEPFVVAAHACLLPKDVPWIHNGKDHLEFLQAVTWPDEVVQQEPGCSTRFQSYTAVSAAYAVALVAEKALDALDKGIKQQKVYSWTRSQTYLDKAWNHLELREWAQRDDRGNGLPVDGTLIERSFPPEMIDP